MGKSGDALGSSRGGVGRETIGGGEVRTAQGSRPGSTASEFAAAKRELASQHPHHPFDGRPHYEDKSYVRHERLGGLKPARG